jgi:hypothetical protein
LWIATVKKLDLDNVFNYRKESKRRFHYRYHSSIHTPDSTIADFPSLSFARKFENKTDQISFERYLLGKSCSGFIGKTGKTMSRGLAKKRLSSQIPVILAGDFLRTLF